jgi:hypothetical protein
MLTPFLKMPAVTTIFGDGSGAPQPVPATLAVEEPDQEYIELSKRLGINKIPLQLIELARVIREVCIGVYEYDAVTRYLDGQVERKRKNRFDYTDWNWHPIKSSNGFWSGWPNHVSADVYNKPIPMPVMLTIDRIESLYPSARFYVSDIRDVKDPFLAVTVDGADTFFVIERWDEPSFRSGSGRSRTWVSR